MANWVNNYIVLESANSELLDQIKRALEEDRISDIIDVEDAFIGIELEVTSRSDCLVLRSRTKWRPPIDELDALAKQCSVAGYFSEWQMCFYAMLWRGDWVKLGNPALDAPPEFWDYLNQKEAYLGRPENPSKQAWDCGCAGRIPVCQICYAKRGTDDHCCKPHTSSPLQRDTYELGYPAIRDFVTSTFALNSICLQGWNDESGPVFGFDDKADAAKFTLRYIGASRASLIENQARQTKVSTGLAVSQAPTADEIIAELRRNASE